MTIKEWQKEVHQGARKRGWYDGELGKKTELRMTSLLCLIHSEVSEALEDLRKGSMELDMMPTRDPAVYKPVGFPSELADIVIRVLDMAEWLGIDMEKQMDIKNHYNKTRGYKHGGKAI
jgi:NTP pyrophosphatase (non-canonical NTP hydrolase)